MNDDDRQAIREFREAVNMTPKALSDWLDTDTSKAVGFKADGQGESVGHRSGRHIVEMLEKKQDGYTDEDVAHARKVVGYIHRHSAQRPEGDVRDTPWRHSLMNWGHDPLRAGR